MHLDASGVGPSQNIPQYFPESARIPLSIQTTHQELSIPGAYHLGTGVPVTQSFLGVDQPAYPQNLNALRHAHADVNHFRPRYVPVQPAVVAEPDRDAYARVSDDEAESEQDDSLSVSSDGTDWDDDEQDPGSDLGSNAGSESGSEGAILDAEDHGPEADIATLDVEDHEPSGDPSTPDAEDDASSDGADSLAVENGEPLGGMPALQIENTTPQYCRGDEFHLKPPPMSNLPPVAEKVEDLPSKALIKSMIEKGELDDVLKNFGYETSGKPAATVQTAPAASTSSAPAIPQLNKCGVCTKLFSRPCELRYV